MKIVRNSNNPTISTVIEIFNKCAIQAEIG